MIAHVFGKIAEKFNNSVIVDVNGVGYELTITNQDYESVSLNDEVKFYTYHSIRENSEELYGFLSLTAKKVFEMSTISCIIIEHAKISALSVEEAPFSPQGGEKNDKLRAYVHYRSCYRR